MSKIADERLSRDDTGRVTFDYEPTPTEIEVCRDAICREFGNNGTDGYYISILKAVHAAASLRAQGGVSRFVEVGEFIASSEHGVGVKWGDLGPLGTGDKIYALSAIEASPAPVSEEWLDPSTAPKDGTIVRLLVKPDMEAFTSLQDSEDAFETIGFNHSDESGEDTWHFAGWGWAHDCITQGHGEVIGWAAFSSLAALAAKGGQ